MEACALVLQNAAGDLLQVVLFIEPNLKTLFGTFIDSDRDPGRHDTFAFAIGDILLIWHLFVLFYDLGFALNGPRRVSPLCGRIVGLSLAIDSSWF